MREKIQISTILFFITTLALFLPNQVQSQTDGTLTFTFTETVSGASKNVLAVWVEDNSNVFVKTRMRYWGNGTNDHLPSWKSNSGQNIVDALTGATRTSSTNPPAFGMKTVFWDGKDINGNTVADGTYKILVESAWNNPEPPHNQHSDMIEFMFEKTDAETHATPAGNSHFSDITIDWVPTGVFVETQTVNNFVSVYPNPSSGKVQILFEKPINVSRILVENINGIVVYQEAVNQTISGVHSLDLQQLSNGIYFIEVLSSENTDHFKTKIIISK